MEQAPHLAARLLTIRSAARSLPSAPEGTNRTLPPDRGVALALGVGARQLSPSCVASPLRLGLWRRPAGLLRLGVAVDWAAAQIHEGFQDIDWDREQGGGVVLCGYFLERLQVAKLHGDRAASHYVGRVGQLLRGLEFALRRDHLGAPLALREGNPFFMEEMVQALLEQGVLDDPVARLYNERRPTSRSTRPDVALWRNRQARNRHQSDAAAEAGTPPLP